MIYTLLSALLLPLEPPVAPLKHFVGSYAVWLSANEGRCNFWLTDVGENSSQLTQSLSNGVYDKALGIELLTQRDTPRRCVRQGQLAASKAGFSKIRVRRGTQRDRSPGIP